VGARRCRFLRSSAPLDAWPGPLGMSVLATSGHAIGEVFACAI
jgi:hypothetical protein